MCNAFYTVAQNRVIRLIEKISRKIFKTYEAYHKINFSAENCEDQTIRSSAWFKTSSVDLPFVIESANSYVGTKFIKKI